jgi:3-methyladenine DNA glycosylase AlkD
MPHPPPSRRKARVTATGILRELRAVADPSRKPGMAFVGVNVDRALGVSVPQIRTIAKRCGTDQSLALALWRSGVHEARMLATLVADPDAMTEADVERWVTDIDSWDVGDFAADLFVGIRGRDRRIRAWSRRPEGFVRRAAFAMIARRAVSDRDAPDMAFLRYLPLIRSAATDDRNEVKKGVNWALRQIGKRNTALNAAAIDAAEKLLEIDSRSARWIARDALRELRSEAVHRRLRERAGPGP